MQSVGREKNYLYLKSKKIKKRKGRWGRERKSRRWQLSPGLGTPPERAGPLSRLHVEGEEARALSPSLVKRELSLRSPWLRGQGRSSVEAPARCGKRPQWDCLSRAACWFQQRGARCDATASQPRPGQRGLHHPHKGSAQGGTTLHGCTDSTHNIALQKSVIPVWHQPFLFQERWFEVWEGKWHRKLWRTGSAICNKGTTTLTLQTGLLLVTIPYKNNFVPCPDAGLPHTLQGSNVPEPQGEPVIVKSHPRFRWPPSHCHAQLGYFMDWAHQLSPASWSWV